MVLIRVRWRLICGRLRQGVRTWPISPNRTFPKHYTICVYIFMCQTGRHPAFVCQSCSGSAEPEKLQRKHFFPCPRSRLKIRPHEAGLTVPSRISLLFLHTPEAGKQQQTTHGLRFFLSVSSTASIYIVKPPLGQPRVYRVAQTRADGNHRQESAGVWSGLFQSFGVL